MSVGVLLRGLPPASGPAEIPDSTASCRSEVA